MFAESRSQSALGYLKGWMMAQCFFANRYWPEKWGGRWLGIFWYISTLILIGRCTLGNYFYPIHRPSLHLRRSMGRAKNLAEAFPWPEKFAGSYRLQLERFLWSEQRQKTMWPNHSPRQQWWRHWVQWCWWWGWDSQNCPKKNLWKEALHMGKKCVCQSW